MMTNEAESGPDCEAPVKIFKISFRKFCVSMNDFIKVLR